MSVEHYENNLVYGKYLYVLIIFKLKNKNTSSKTDFYMSKVPLYIGIFTPVKLSQLAKMLCLSYYCLCFLFNKIRDKGRTDSTRKRGGMGGRGRGQGIGGRNGPNNVCTCE
jgi:hypothetical protein